MMKYTMNNNEMHIESFADEAPLTYLFGNSARVKIIGAFIADAGRELSVSEIARRAGVARSTVYEHLDHLEHMNVIVHTRDSREGHSPMYQFNEDSELGTVLYQLEGYALEQLMESDHF